MGFSTALYYFLLGSVPIAVFVVGMATTDAGSWKRFVMLLIGLVALLTADFRVVMLAMSRATRTPGTAVDMSSVFLQPEIIAFGAGLASVFALWACYIALRNRPDAPKTH